MVDSSSPDHGVALRGLPAAAKAVVAQFLSTSDVPAGALLVREGDRSRELYFVAEGEVRLLRAGAEIARLGPGDPIGDLPFVAGLPSPTTAVAATRLRLAHLSFERFRVLSATHPEVGAALHDLLVTRLSFAGARASREPPPLVHERSLPRRAEVSVRIQGVVRQVPVGIAVRHLLPERLKGHLVAAAILDHKAVSLMTPVTAACEVAPLSTDHWEGQRVHRRSLGLAVLEALRRVAPDVQARIGPSLGFAQRVLLLGVPKADIDGLAGRLKGAISELVAEAAPLREEWWSVNEALEHFTAERSDAAALLQTWRDPSVPLVSYGQVYAIELGPLLPHTGLLQGFHVLADEDALVLVYGAESSARPLASRLFPAVPESWGAASGVAPAALAMPPEGDPEAAYLARHARRASAYASAVTVQQERWLAALEVTSVGAFNRACVSGDVSQIVRVSEGFHEKRIGAIADEIRDRLPDVRVVCIAGPSSSGKSTFIRRLEVQLQVNGIRPVGLSLDDYYVDRHLTPKDAEGALDYEAFEALRIDLLGDQVARLLDGLTVTTARYDFTTGVSQPEGGRSLALGDRAVLLLEGIHGLNPRLLSNLPAERVLRIFCSPLAQLPFDSLTRVHASDVRLIRRVVRDRHSRSTDAAGTIARWPSVRAGERSHIFPFQHHADAVFDSSLVYEMGVLRVFAERYLLEVPRAHPSYATAFRLIRLLDRFVAIYPDHVPRTSILREFVGGPGL